MLKASRKSAAKSLREEKYVLLSRGHRGALFQLRLNYIASRSRLSPRKVRLPSKGEHHVLYACNWQKEKNGNGGGKSGEVYESRGREQWRRAAPKEDRDDGMYNSGLYTVDSLLKPRLMASSERSFNPIGEGGRSAIGRKERQRRLRQTDEKGNGRKPKDGGEKPPLPGCDKTLVERQLRRAFFFFLKEVSLFLSLSTL